jgi:hypothetical protein
VSFACYRVCLQLGAAPGVGYVFWSASEISLAVRCTSRMTATVLHWERHTSVLQRDSRRKRPNFLSITHKFGFDAAKLVGN